ncbi:MAG: glycosyltransferase family 4 protein [Pseudomonadota bacterium]
MKIVHLGIRHSGWRGGVQTYIRELYTRTRNRGHSVGVYFVPKKGVCVESAPGIYSVDVPFSNDFVRLRLQNIYSNVLGAISDADLIHYHHYGPAFYSFIQALANKPTVYTFHGSAAVACDHSVKKHFIEWIEKRALRSCDRIVVVTKGLARLLDSYDISHTFIPHGADPQHGPISDQDIYERFGLRKGEYLLHVGRLLPAKGAAVLIQAFRKLKNASKPLVICGDSDNLAYIEQLRSLAYDSQGTVRLLGNVEDDLLHALYSNAYLFVSPLQIKGFPLAVVEAMSHGRCVVMSDAYETEEPHHAYGIRTAPGNVADLKKVLEELLVDEQKVAHWGAKAKAYVAKAHNWEKVVREYEDIYAQLTQHHRVKDCRKHT